MLVFRELTTGGQKMTESAIERLKTKENAVIHPGGISSSTAHIPIVEQGDLTSLCGRESPSWQSSALESFRRRRRASLCKPCKVHLHLADGNVESALTSPSILLKEFEGVTIGQLLHGEISSGEVVGIPEREVV